MTVDVPEGAVLVVAFTRERGDLHLRVLKGDECLVPHKLAMIERLARAALEELRALAQAAKGGTLPGAA